MRHTGPQLAHALAPPAPHPHEGAACDLGQWRRWGERPHVLEALFAFCRGVAGLRWRVWLWGCREAPARTRSSPSTGLKDAVRVGAVRGLTVQRGAVLTRVAEELHELN